VGQAFLRAHWNAVLAADFFTTEVWTVRGLVTYYTLFVIELHSRRVSIVGSTPQPDEVFVRQVVRQLTAADEGVLDGPAERFVRSVKEECLDRMIPLGERHFRRALADFVVHCHRERNHQGLGNELIDGINVQPQNGCVRRRQRVGGLLSYYYRAA
jgi:hypothetical protein